MVKRISTFTGIVLLAIFLAACGSSQAPASQPIPTDTPAPVTPPAISGITTVSISGYAFDPVTITIKAGQSITWTNKDSVVHTVTADDGSWASKELANGDTYTQTFTTAGTYNYHCAAHPYMTGTVIVEP
jgi:plastocyanin